MANCSQIPGNIGTVKSKVLVWDHDPVLARNNQDIHFGLDAGLKAEIPKYVLSDIEFVPDGSFLKPVTDHSDNMFVAADNPHVFDATSIKYVENELSVRYIPGGDIYENTAFNPYNKNNFPHMLWMHTGSILRDGVLIYPNEYGKNANELENKYKDTPATSGNSFTPPRPTEQDFRNAPKWSMMIDQNTNIIMPYMIDKHTPNDPTAGEEDASTVHWTLEKWTKLWHGEDFIVEIKKGEKNLDTQIDPLMLLDQKKFTGSYATKTYNEKYINFMPVPSNAPWPESQDGIQNEAVTVLTKDKKDIDRRASRNKYWMKYQSYILIEFGYIGDSEDELHKQHYFIELVKGRNPRFLHLGKVDDLKDRNVDLSTPEGRKKGFGEVKKLRVLSEYPTVSCTDLFNQDSFHFTVRNHLGSLYITFSGHEDQPWKIVRYDKKLSDEGAIEEFEATCSVTNAGCKIHGGNISCGISFSPLYYSSGGIIPLTDRQITTKNAKNENIYITFSNMGRNTNIAAEERDIKKHFKNKKNFKYQNVGYDCEARYIDECIENKKSPLNLYDTYHGTYYDFLGDKQYLGLGKGFWGNKILQFDDKDNFFSASRLSIINLDDKESGATFKMGLDDDDYEFKDYVSKLNIGISFTAGSIFIPKDLVEKDGGKISRIDPSIENARFTDVITPIATSVRIVVDGGFKPIYDNISSPIDITNLVSHISDKWNVEEYYVIRHDTTLKCYIPVGMTDNSAEIYNLGQKLLALRDKNMYITISYWWDNGVGEQFPAGLSGTYGGRRPEINQALIQMTGMAFGGEIERSNNLIYMNLNVKDYMSIFEHKYMMNSPFFDAVNDAVAIYEISKMAGLDDSAREGEFLHGRTRGNIDRRPLGFLQKMISENKNGKVSMFYNGERFYIPPYALPGSYADLARPSVKFSNGERYLDAIKKIAQLAGKTVYFDRYGVLKLERNAATEVAFYSGGAGGFKQLPKKYDFVTSPRHNLVEEDDLGGLFPPFKFDPETDASHLVYNMVKYNRDVESAVNQVSLYSATNRFINERGERIGGFVVKGYTFFDQIFNPESEGFIGFMKMFYQSNGLFGSDDGMKTAMQHYAKMVYPPYITSFEAYGVPGLKPLDIVTLDNNPVYITEISHDIDPAQNRWWMNITAEWLKPYTDDLKFEDTTEQPIPPPA